MKSRKWAVTADKLLTREQIESLLSYLKDERDLAIARSKKPQAIKDYYIIRTFLETGVRLFELCALVNSDFRGHKLSVRNGKGNIAGSDRMRLGCLH